MTKNFRIDLLLSLRGDKVQIYLINSKYAKVLINSESAKIWINLIKVHISPVGEVWKTLTVGHCLKVFSTIQEYNFSSEALQSL